MKKLFALVVAAAMGISSVAFAAETTATPAPAVKHQVKQHHTAKKAVVQKAQATKKHHGKKPVTQKAQAAKKHHAKKTVNK